MPPFLFPGDEVQVNDEQYIITGLELNLFFLADRTQSFVRIQQAEKSGQVLAWQVQASTAGKYRGLVEGLHCCIPHLCDLVEGNKEEYDGEQFRIDGIFLQNNHVMYRGENQTIAKKLTTLYDEVWDEASSGLDVKVVDTLTMAKAIHVGITAESAREMLHMAHYKELKQGVYADEYARLEKQRFNMIPAHGFSVLRQSMFNGQRHLHK